MRFFVQLMICIVFVTALFFVSAEAKMNQVLDSEVGAKKLYQAWRVGNRKAASRIADKSALNKLFSTRWRPMVFKGCTNIKPEGGFECIYRDRKNDLDLALIFKGGLSAGGYKVVSLSFSSEAVFLPPRKNSGDVSLAE